MAQPTEPTWLTIRLKAASATDAYAILSRISTVERLKIQMEDASLYNLLTDSRVGPIHVGTAVISGGDSIPDQPTKEN